MLEMRDINLTEWLSPGIEFHDTMLRMLSVSGPGQNFLTSLSIPTAKFTDFTEAFSRFSFQLENVDGIGVTKLAPNTAILSFSSNAQASCASAMSISVMLLEGKDTCLKTLNTTLFSPSMYAFTGKVARNLE